MIEQRIEELVLQQLDHSDFEGYFLLEVTMTPAKHLYVILDADSGVDLVACKKMSRFLEKHIDEGEWLTNYEIEVSSPGLSRPLQVPRQYVKNIGRELEIVDEELVKTIGKLVEANEESATIEFEEVRKEGKKKIKEMIRKTYAYANIKRALIQVSFK